MRHENGPGAEERGDVGGGRMRPRRVRRRRKKVGLGFERAVRVAELSGPHRGLWGAIGREDAGGGRN